MYDRENVIKAIRFESPEYIPMIFHINGACWHHYDQTFLQDLMEEHKFLFPDFKRSEKVTPKYGLNELKDISYTDPWGCVWKTTDDGIVGSVHEHPLASWENFEKYKAPDPNMADGTFPIDWEKTSLDVQRRKKKGELIIGSLPHGHTFLRLQDIRGYENLIFDMADKEPRLLKLIEMVEEFNYQCVKKWMNMKPDIMCYPEDLGMQFGPMLSPEYFRQYIKPVYQKIMQSAKVSGCIVHMHSDGDIRMLANDLIDDGVEVINLQDLVNGVDWIADKFAGRICVGLDIDRQHITAQGTPEQIDALICEEIKKIGSKQGGLLMIYGLYPDVPPKNIKTLMDAMEKYSTYY